MVAILAYAPQTPPPGLALTRTAEWHRLSETRTVRGQNRRLADGVAAASVAVARMRLQASA
jgi:hypothetical protein